MNTGEKIIEKVLVIKITKDQVEVWHPALDELFISANQLGTLRNYIQKYDEIKVEFEVKKWVPLEFQTKVVQNDY